MTKDDDVVELDVIVLLLDHAIVAGALRDRFDASRNSCLVELSSSRATYSTYVS